LSALARKHSCLCLCRICRSSPGLSSTTYAARTAYTAGNDPRAWAAAMLRLLTDEGAWIVARAEGLEHARGFSWEKTTAAVRDRLLPA
jgi:glycosyltransferase involved in cell wall biosynthesis